MTVLMGSAAIVLDAGDIWQQRRQLVGAVDAAALAAAADFAVDVDGCATTADSYVEANAPDVGSTDCVSTGIGSAGQVTVTAEVTVQHAIAQILGKESTLVDATTTAQWGPATSLTGLRPFALCEGAPAFQSWVASGFSTDETFRIEYTKEQADACGGPAPGNWGLLDFDGGANSNQDTKEWVEFGYPGEVDAPDWIDGDTGAFSQSLPISAVLNKVIHVPVFDDYNGAGGSNADFHVVGFVSLKIVDYKANGSESSRYLDVVFQTTVAAGKCCNGSTVDGGTRAVGLCAVENEGTCG